MIEKLKVALAAIAISVIGSVATAATTADLRIGADSLGNSGDQTELDALCGYIAGCDVNDNDLTILNKDANAGLVIQYDAVSDVYFVSVDPDEPGYFILKFGGGGLTGPNTFFFQNIDDLTILAWSIDDLDGVSQEAWGDCVAGDTVGGNCRLSHVTTVGPVAVPVPAAAWMLLGGLGGLAALRRRKRA